MKSKLIFIIILASIILVSGCTQPAADSPASKTADTAGKTGDTVKGDAASPGSPIVDEPSSATTEVKEISITAKQWEFIPSKITVSKGDNVKLIIENVDVAHGISIPDFGISAPLQPGENTVVEFTADKAGSFSFFCNVFCGSGHSQMKGTLVVE